jgi:opacity protein-like surface antigen
MNKLLLTTTAGAILALTFSTAQAADLKPGGAFKADTGLYVSGSIGAVIPGDSKLDEGRNALSNTKLEFDTGMSYGGAVGYDFGAIRVEGELSHMSSDLKDDGYEADAGLVQTGDMSATALMANAWYDIDTGTKFTPYVGGGIGVAKVKGNSSRDYEADEQIPDGHNLTYASFSNTEFAYQVGAGVDYSLTEDMTVGLGYKYLASGDNDFHTVNVGMRYTF